MVNYKTKSHYDRSANDKVDFLYIIKIKDYIFLVYAPEILNKRVEILVPIFYQQVAAISPIWTDGCKSYFRLNQYKHEHEHGSGSGCCKVEFLRSNKLNIRRESIWQPN